eukprot:1403099-Pyramimonas_sp.AAC.1
MRRGRRGGRSAGFASDGVQRSAALMPPALAADADHPRPRGAAIREGQGGGDEAIREGKTAITMLFRISKSMFQGVYPGPPSNAM